jgi:glycosyltransferase involved in cell wall biosynthesis
MPKQPLIHFVHEGKAAYPEVAALRSYFGARGFDTVEGPSSDVVATDRASASWHMMGFYPRRLPVDVTIHDYRSLSVGRLSRVKDGVKRALNAKPDLRFFQNQEIRQALGFPEDSRTYYLPMGVPQFFIANRSVAPPPSTDFVYIGSMLGERRCELMLDSFVKRFGGTKAFDLYGAPNPALVERYKDHPNIRFPGAVPQERLPAILKAARVGVCYFPMHYPHLLQAPTKLMEYAALGMRVLANDHPQSRIVVANFGLNCRWGANGDMFANVSDTLDWENNSSIDPEPMSWDSVIAESGVEAALRQALKLD